VRTQNTPACITARLLPGAQLPRRLKGRVVMSLIAIRLAARSDSTQPRLAHAIRGSSSSFRKSKLWAFSPLVPAEEPSWTV
jgi:hypothetical protein